MSTGLEGPAQVKGTHGVLRGQVGPFREVDTIAAASSPAARATLPVSARIVVLARSPSPGVLTIFRDRRVGRGGAATGAFVDGFVNGLANPLLVRGLSMAFGSLARGAGTRTRPRAVPVESGSTHLPQGLGCTEEQKGARRERVRQAVEKCASVLGGKIDEHVAAEDHSHEPTKLGTSSTRLCSSDVTRARTQSF